MWDDRERITPGLTVAILFALRNGSGSDVDFDVLTSSDSKAGAKSNGTDYSQGAFRSELSRSSQGRAGIHAFVTTVNDHVLSVGGLTHVSHHVLKHELVRNVRRQAAKVLQVLRFIRVDGVDFVHDPLSSAASTHDVLYPLRAFIKAGFEWCVRNVRAHSRTIVPTHTVDGLHVQFIARFVERVEHVVTEGTSDNLIVEDRQSHPRRSSLMNGAIRLNSFYA